MYFISLGFVASACAELGVGVHFWRNFSSDDFYNYTANSFFTLSGGKQKTSKWTIIMLSSLTFCLVFYYISMRRVMDRYFNHTLHAEKRKIKILFAVFLTAYTFRAALAYGQRYYYELVC
jgi:hypothetical protein